MAWQVLSILGLAIFSLSSARPPYSEQRISIKNHVLEHVGSDAQGHQEKYAWAYPSYEFAYKVVDHHTHDIKGHDEHRDGDKVKGKYWLVEPTGRKRVVNYHADKHHGFNADVGYMDKWDEGQENNEGENENRQEGNEESNGGNNGEEERNEGGQNEAGNEEGGRSENENGESEGENENNGENSGAHSDEGKVHRGGESGDDNNENHGGEGHNENNEGGENNGGEEKGHGHGKKRIIIWYQRPKHVYNNEKHHGNGGHEHGADESKEQYNDELHSIELLRDISVKHEGGHHGHSNEEQNNDNNEGESKSEENARNENEKEGEAGEDKEKKVRLTEYEIKIHHPKYKHHSKIHHGWDKRSL